MSCNTRQYVTLHVRRGPALLDVRPLAIFSLGDDAGCMGLRVPSPLKMYGNGEIIISSASSRLLKYTRVCSGFPVGEKHTLEIFFFFFFHIVVHKSIVYSKISTNLQKKNNNINNYCICGGRMFRVSIDKPNNIYIYIFVFRKKKPVHYYDVRQCYLE